MLYFDEAGYTGAELTNEKQPYFTLASVRLEDEEIEQIKLDIGYDEWGKEFHFKSMYKDPLARIMLGKVFSHPLLNGERVKLAYAYKRYCIYAQIVNILIETFYHNQGINIYKGASNLVMANCMYYGAILHTNKELVKEFEVNFVRMVRVQDVDSVADFYRTTDRLRADEGTTEMMHEILDLVPPTIYTIKGALDVALFYMDLTVPLFSESIQKWYAETGMYDENDTAQIKSTPAKGFRFLKWSDGVENAERNLAVTDDISLIAIFESDGTGSGSGSQNSGQQSADNLGQQSQNRKYTISVTSANTAQGTVTGGGTYIEGSRVNISATPASGYAFDKWSDGNTSATRTVSVSKNESFVAQFKVADGTENPGGSGDDSDTYI